MSGSSYHGKGAKHGNYSRATYADLEAVPEYLVAEIIDGVLVTRHHGYASPAMARTALSFALHSATQTASNRSAQWQVVVLPEIRLAGNLVVPELAAWKVARMPFLQDENPEISPDWVCELMFDDADSNPALTRKLELYRKVGVPLVWIVDMTARCLVLIDNTSGTRGVIARGDDIVRASPFDAISFSLADLWPLDPPLGMNEDPTPYYAGDR